MQFWSPDDGRKNRLKHVERLTKINKLWNAASCWLYSAKTMQPALPLYGIEKPHCQYGAELSMFLQIRFTRHSRLVEVGRRHYFIKIEWHDHHTKLRDKQRCRSPRRDRMQGDDQMASLFLGFYIRSRWMIKTFRPPRESTLVQWRTEGGGVWGGSTPPRNFEGPPKSCQTQPDSENC